ncbi:MAG: hypothetical protein GC162_21080 [Planctomycetes bacterium]|nr:hypothetical protein [Planctomycetota bacterium]
MSKAQVLAIIMALTLAVVVFAVINGISSHPAATTTATDETAPLQLDVSQIKAVVDQAVAKRIAELPPPAPAKPPEPDKSPMVERVPVDGQDLVDIERLWMWKFHYRVPSTQYTAYVWTERWTRGAAKPELTKLLANLGTESEGDIVIKLPTEINAEQFVRVGSLESRRAKAPALQIGMPPYIEALKSEPIELNKDIYLVTFTYNEAGAAIGGRVNVHRDHDVTIYVKARFTNGAFIDFDQPGAPGGPTTAPAPDTTPDADTN